MKKLATKRSSKNERPLANRGPRRDWRIWQAEFGHGRDAMIGLLVTDGQPFPMPIGFVEGDGAAAAHLARDVANALADVGMLVDLSRSTLNEFAQELDGKILIPIERQSAYPMERDDFFAAGRYSLTKADGEVCAGFTWITRRGLDAIRQEEWDKSAKKIIGEQNAARRQTRRTNKEGGK